MAHKIGLPANVLKIDYMVAD